MATRDNDCSTKSLIPTWVTIAFMGCTLSMLIVTSVYSFRSLKGRSSLNTDRKKKTDEEQKEDISDNNRSSTAITPSKWDNASCAGKCILWIKDIWSRKSVYVPLVAHLSDTATDFAAVIEFYQIAEANPNGCENINVWYLFGLSLSTMIIYRIISSLTIWRITGSIKRVILQFLDIELFQILHLSHRLGLKSKSSPQRLISSMEAVFEAAPQSMIQMVYLLKTGNLSNVIFISAMVSFINLTMSILSDDKQYLNVSFVKPWKKSKAAVGSYAIQRSGCWHFSKFITLYLFRICDVPSSILLYVFTWYYLSGYALTIIVCLDVVIALILFGISKNTDALLSIIAIPMSFGSETYANFLLAFWCYSFIKCVIMSIIIWLSVSDDFLNDPLAASLWIFCFCAYILKYCLGGILLLVFEIDRVFSKAKERNNVDALVKSGCYDDAIELIFYRNFNVQENAKKLYGDSGYHLFSLLAIAAGCKQNVDVFQYIFNIVGLDVDIDHDKYRNSSYVTALSTASQNRNKDYIRTILKVADLKYINKDRQNYGLRMSGDCRAIWHAIYWGSNTDDDGVVDAFLECINDHTLKDDAYAGRKKIELLTYTESYSDDDTDTMLHFAVKYKKSLSVFRSLYNFFPPSYQKKALNIRNGDGKTISDYINEVDDDDEMMKEIKLYIYKKTHEDDVVVGGQNSNNSTINMEDK